MKRLSIWLMLSLATTVLVAGCGSSSSSNPTSNSQSTSAPAATRPGAAAGSTTTSSSSSTQPSAAATKDSIRKFAQRACRNQIQANLALTSVEKGKLESLCSKAGTGVAATREITRRVCAEIVKHAAIPGRPETAAQKQATEGCRSAK